MFILTSTGGELMNRQTTVHWVQYSTSPFRLYDIFDVKIFSGSQPEKDAWANLVKFTISLVSF